MVFTKFHGDGLIADYADQVIMLKLFDHVRPWFLMVVTYPWTACHLARLQ